MPDAPRRYREPDEVKAPEDLPAASVRAGDRGVVVAELHNPDANPPDAVEVEYADEQGVPKAFTLGGTDGVVVAHLSRCLVC